MKSLKIEPFSGLSGDMFLGALCGLVEKDKKKELLDLPNLLGLDGCSIEITECERGSIHCNRVIIRQHEEQDHRHLEDILKIINNSKLNNETKILATKIFINLAEAEADVHGTTEDEIHFHEVGAIDSILDIVGTSVLLEHLKIDKIYSLPICVGFGLVKCEHGTLPVPAPATALLLQNIPCYSGDIAQEMTTPTGAAILKTLNPSFTLPIHESIAISYGAGSKDFSIPNCLRLSLINEPNQIKDYPFTHGNVYIIESNLDDISSELMGEHLQNTLFQTGALDVSIYPMIMKKGRPAFKLEVLCHTEKLRDLCELIFEETSTIGIRFHKADRYILKWVKETIETKFGNLEIKKISLPSGKYRSTPEYESAKKLALKHKVSLQEIYSEINKYGS